MSKKIVILTTLVAIFVPLFLFIIYSSPFMLKRQINDSIGLRKFPYPYRNMLAILSDTDECDKAEFEGMHRFMNTYEDCGNLGKGVGLDIGDTFWMCTVGKSDRGKNSSDWLYWNYDTRREINASAMRRYIKAGWIDIPHTFFNFYNSSKFSRKLAVDVLNEWERIGYKPFAWIDHGNNPWNMCFFGEGNLLSDTCEDDYTLDIGIKSLSQPIKVGDYIFIPRTGEKAFIKDVNLVGSTAKITLESNLKNPYFSGEILSIHYISNLGERAGAIPDSTYYCADLTEHAGIKAYWVDIPKDLSKSTAGGKYGFESCLRPYKLPNGKTVWGFMRYYENGQTNNTYLGSCINRVLYGDTISGSRKMDLDTYVIIATHFGYADSDGVMDRKYVPETDLNFFNGDRWFNNETVDAFRTLRSKQDAGEILVAKTSRLLKYNLVSDILKKNANSNSGYTIEYYGGITKITIHIIHDEYFGDFTPTVEDLRGITFYCDKPDDTEIWIEDTEVTKDDIQINQPDQSGMKSIGIKWFTPDTKDYTRQN